MQKEVLTIEEATILFAGDSGDGSRTIGITTAEASAIAGNDVATFPDYPAEIRAPAGTLPGISGFQVKFSSYDIQTPGDICDVLVVMNPAALKVNLNRLKPNGIIIVNLDNFKPRNLRLAGYEKNPLEDGSLTQFQIFPIELTRLTRAALKDTGFSPNEMDLCKNFFALGLIFWLYNRPMDYTIQWIRDYYGKHPKYGKYVDADIMALKAGHIYGEATEQLMASYEVKPAKFPPGTYRSITGASATSLGLISASQKAGIPLVYGSYPITPASEILHELSKHRNFGIITMQMEDEIAAIGVAIGAGYSGALGVTGSSGPGISLKAEATNLAVMAELPIVVCNIQRAGPSTGMPTKTEQSDLFQVMFGRNGESPVPVVAASSPTDCFDTAYEACRIALKYMTPVIFMSDLFISFGAEPWRIPKVSELPDIKPNFRTALDGFEPYVRDEQTLARPWATPGTPGLEHRIGGLEKEHLTGNVSYDPENHEQMVQIRSEKIARIVSEIPETPIFGEPTGELLVIGWGGTYGTIRTAVAQKQEEGASVSHVHLRYLNPLPSDLEDILNRFDKVLVAELNLGQLLKLIRAEYLIEAVGLNKVQGQPFFVSEINEKIDEMLD